jgi:nitrogen regulatory protein PII
MKLFETKLLTIICEILAQENILDILKKHQISGYTKYEVDGDGDRGLRGQGLKTEKNIKFEIIMNENKLQDVIEEISRTLFANYAIVLHVTDIGVLRPEKF